MGSRIVLAALAALLIAFCWPAHAEPVFIASLDRVAVGAGLNYVGRFDTGTEPVPDPDHEWEGGLYGSYVLVPRLAVTVQAERGFDVKRWEFLAPGLNLRLSGPSDPVSFALKAGYRTYSSEAGQVPAFGKEWIVGMTAGKALTDWLLVTGALDYGLDNKQTKLSGGLRLAHAFGEGY